MESEKKTQRRRKREKIHGKETGWEIFSAKKEGVSPGEM